MNNRYNKLDTNLIQEKFINTIYNVVFCGTVRQDRRNGERMYIYFTNIMTLIIYEQKCKKIELNYFVTLVSVIPSI